MTLQELTRHEWLSRIFLMMMKSEKVSGCTKRYILFRYAADKRRVKNKSSHALVLSSINSRHFYIFFHADYLIFSVKAEETFWVLVDGRYYFPFLGICIPSRSTSVLIISRVNPLVTIK